MLRSCDLGHMKQLMTTTATSILPLPLDKWTYKTLLRLRIRCRRKRQKSSVKSLHKTTTIMTFTMVNVAEKGRYIFYFVTFMFLKYHMSHPHLIVFGRPLTKSFQSDDYIPGDGTTQTIKTEVFLTTFCGIWERGMPPHNSGVTMIPLGNHTAATQVWNLLEPASASAAICLQKLRKNTSLGRHNSH